MTDSLENKVDSTFYRIDIEKQYGKLTDEQWLVVAGEIVESLIDYWVQADVPHIIGNLEHLVSQDEKYD